MSATTSWSIAELREAGLLRAVAEAGTREVYLVTAGGDAQEIAEASAAAINVHRQDPDPGWGFTPAL
ncbi:MULTISPECIES: hypothetical protein [unclassified Streptomyces]|uniref:hypothetical protein n=1 Tax=unclassified Streptomyces TaxID=2593676 RepID=UPI0001C1CB83|nr:MULTISPECIES: hypothetical protein [unclassified Streptomyces]AEN08657.1 transketolase [Streptomyces sp. SirexAA-E]MYR64966.1 transketolase [Streptomyces sp. SID4939]MYS04053.1 transketolase [Streptomyces sp. SID4940]MYT65531.1 transketolase [Streptomyces sp. SID8357]MYT89000.1 transketolase [Streptomyces sp. SID8360]